MTIRYERGDSRDVARKTRTQTGTYVLVQHSLLHGDTTTAYNADGSVYWSTRPLAPGNEAKYLRSGMWRDESATRLPEGF